MFRNMSKKTISKEVTEKESKKAKQAKDTLDEKKDRKKVSWEDCLEILNRFR